MAATTWSGTVSDIHAAAVAVSPDVLKRYVGVFTGFWGANPRKVDVALDKGQLVVRINDDSESEPLTPLSNTCSKVPPMVSPMTSSLTATDRPAMSWKSTYLEATRTLAVSDRLGDGPR